MIKAKQNKKSIASFGAIITSICMCVMLTGCGDTNESANKKDKETKAEVTTTTKDNASTQHEPGCYATIDIQDYGTIEVKLEPDSAPVTVDNFIKLAESGFYEGLTFHRIMEGFMMQGGAPKNEEAETIVGEFTLNGYLNQLSHTRGAISMARTPEYNSASSQFFIVHEDSTFLDGQYAAFGYVTKGIEVVDAVCEASEPTDNNGTIPEDKQPIITSVTIARY